MINILLVEDHHMIRYGLKRLLESDKHMCVAGEATNGQEALNLLDNIADIDVVLTDLNMPVLDGIALADTLKKSGSSIKVIILSMHEKKAHIYKAFHAGVSAYLSKNIDPAELLFVMQHVHSGGRYLSSTLSMRMLDDTLAKPLSDEPDQKINFELSGKEMDVLNLIADGDTSQRMSEKMYLSKRTVEGYRKDLMKKFGVVNTAKLIRTAMRLGLVH
jgi:DNA-binding NarL/FixJ family response regulator